MQIGLSSMPDRVPDPTSTDPGAQTSGQGFNRLIAAAQAEADRRKSIAAQSGASADQFSEQGWLAIVKAHGAEIGLGAAANAITKDSHGQFTVVNSALRAKVINYRNDPLVRSIMAVKRAGDGKAVLNVELGRQPTDAELRVADAIGAKAAAKLITTRQSTPNASAAIVSPDAAKANRAAFYRPDGSPQTVNDVLVKLMKPADAAAGPDVERLLAGHAAFASPTSPTTPATAQAMPTKGMTPEMAANLRARAAFASASTPTALAPKLRVARPVPPDLALVGGTIGNLSMPGSATGQTAPTGGKVSGWRAQMVGEVTQQIEHPESTVTNLPSKVTIPAPVFGHHDTANLAASAVPVMPEPQQLGPQLVPSALPPQAIPPVAFATPASVSPAVSVAATQPVSETTALPSLVAGPPMEPTSALPLLPISDMPMPLGPDPRAAAAPVAMAPAPVETAAPAAAPVIVRPSRYGPNAGMLARPSVSRALGYAAVSPDMAGSTQSDASSAGIRPSRYFAGSAVTAQQFASLNRSQAPVQPVTQSVAPVTPPAYGQPAASSVIGPDGLPILPPVPGPAGLPPITASEALSSVPEQTALLDGNKPLDLAPPVSASPTAAVGTQPVHLNHKPRPRLTPGNF